MPAGGREREVALWRRLLDGDEAALDELYEEHAAHVYGLAYRVTGDADAAEAVTVEVLASLWADPREYDGERVPLRAFLSRKAHSLAADRARRR